MRKLSRRGVDIAALQLVLVGKGDGVDQEVQPAPLLRNSAKAASSEPCSETSQSITAAGFSGSTSGSTRFLNSVALIGEGEFGAGLVQGLGDAPGDGAVVGDAHDQAALALHEYLRGHALLQESPVPHLG